MDISRRLPHAALVMAFLALVASLTGVADAAGHKIGKNLVVTKSIRNGAVTGHKVKDGSLTGADLAAGTITSTQLAPGVIPVATKDKIVAFAGCSTCVANGPGGTTDLQLSGYLPTGGGPALPLPVTVTLADFDVRGSFQTGGHSLTVQLEYRAPGAPTFTTVPLCTVPDGDSNCDVVGPISVPGRNLAMFTAKAGPSGASGTDVVISYTMQTTP